MSVYEAAEEAFGGDREIQKEVLISNLTPKQKLVYQAIKDYPEAANDDAVLLSIVWTREGWNDRSGLEYCLRHVTRPETLSRRRRELFNMGLIEYSGKKLKDREKAFKSEREQHSTYNPLNDMLGYNPVDELRKLSIKYPSSRNASPSRGLSNFAKPPVFTPYKQTELL